MARALPTINLYFHVTFNLSGIFLLCAMAFDPTQFQSVEKLIPNFSQDLEFKEQLLSICQHLFSQQVENDKNKHLVEMLKLNSRQSSRPNLSNEMLNNNSKILNDYPHIFTKRQGITGGKKVNIDNIRIMQLFGYYPSRGTNRRKELTNSDNTPFHKPQTRSPLLLHFGPWVDNYSPKTQYKNANEIEDSKTNSKLNKVGKQPASKESYEAYTQQQDMPQKSLKGFAFTSNHWGPLG